MKSGFLGLLGRISSKMVSMFSCSKAISSSDCFYSESYFDCFDWFELIDLLCL